ncbi:uncharacterized protein LOC101755427 [Setaria italica]|uniref:uncharacterized protein LOC101755427 n=1 Tax=Setaria italica TaxID=4555 RepID=UPI00035103CB|nr:uncharacterized protein LOC101755427 [Setaria italica]
MNQGGWRMEEGSSEECGWKVKGRRNVAEDDSLEKEEFLSSWRRSGGGYELRIRDHYRELTKEQNLGYEEEQLAIIDTLNAEQMADFEEIFDHVMNGKGQVAMTKRQCVEALDRSLRDIKDCMQPFGSKVMLFGGDFRQVLPVVARGIRAQITDATFLKSYIWESVRCIQLTQNMRAQSDMWFADYLLRISNSTEETFGSKYVLLPDYIYIDSPSEDICIDTVSDRVFLDLPDNRRSASYMCKGAILST